MAESANGGASEESRARDLARRYRCEFVDLKNFHIQHELFRSVPVDLMFRYNFVPLENSKTTTHRRHRRSEPLDDDRRASLLLGKRIVTKVATLSQINDFLKKTEQSQRVLEEAGEGFVLDVIVKTRAATKPSHREASPRKVTSARSFAWWIQPFSRRLSGGLAISISRRCDDSVAIKYRIDGVLREAMKPISRDHQSTIISRIKVMSELDIAERRVPQDGRFRVRYRGGVIDFRVASCLRSTAKTLCCACSIKNP